MTAQATRDQRLAIADLVIDNNGPLEALSPQVRSAWTTLRSRATSP
jgi:dephospho-CoA kinase